MWCLLEVAVAAHLESAIPMEERYSFLNNLTCQVMLSFLKLSMECSAPMLTQHKILCTYRDFHLPGN